MGKVKTRARAKENLKLESVLIVKNGILPKTAIFPTVESAQVKYKSTTPARAIIAINAPSIRNLHMG